MSYIQHQHSLKYSAYGGLSGSTMPDGGAAAAAQQQQQQLQQLQQMPQRGVLLEPQQLNAGGGASPSSRLDDAIAQLRNLGSSSSSVHRAASVRSSSSARSADDDFATDAASPVHSLPRHRPAMPPALFAGVPVPNAWDAPAAGATTAADGEDMTLTRGEAALARMLAPGFSGFTRTIGTTSRQWTGTGTLTYNEGAASSNPTAPPAPLAPLPRQSGRTVVAAVAEAASAAPPPKATVTYDTQGRCSCCPYGFHVDVDFVNMPEASGGSGVVAQLKRIREDRRALRKSVELQLFLQQQLQLQLQQQQQQQQAVDSRSSASRSATTVGGLAASSPSSSSAAPQTEARYATIDQNDANQSLFLDDVDNAVHSIGRVVTFADRPTERSKSSSVSSEDLPQALTSSLPASALAHALVRSDSTETLDSLPTSDGRGGGAHSFAARPSSTVATSTVTSRRFAETMAMHLPDTASTEAVTISPESFRQIKEHVSLSLQRMRELEEQVSAIPVMQERISVLKEEKRLLAVQLKAKDVRTNMRSIGVGDSSADAPTAALRSLGSAASTAKDAAVGSGDVNEELLPGSELHRLVHETVELTRQREIHTWIEAAQLQLNESRLSAVRSIGVGDAVVSADEDLKIREKELRTIVIGQLDDKEQRNVGVQVKAATRDASVLYQYQEEKPLTRTVGVNVDIADLIQSAQEQSAATAASALGAAAASPADATGAAGSAAAAATSLSAAEQSSGGLLITSASSSQSWVLQSYAIQRRFLEASRSGRREDLIAFVQGLLRRSVRSFGVLAKPSACDVSTACDGGGSAGACDAAVGDDRTDVVVRPAFAARDAATSARPEVSSTCTWTESVATRDAASMAAALTADRSTGAMDMASFRRDVGMVTVPASVRSMETNTPPLDVSTWLSRDEAVTSHRSSAQLSARQQRPSEQRAEIGLSQSQRLASPVQGQGGRPASASPSSGEGEQTLYEEWTEVRTIPFEYIGDRVAGGQGVQPLPAELIGLGKLSEAEASSFALASADSRAGFADARRMAGFSRESSMSTTSFASSRHVTVSGSMKGGEALPPPGSAAAATAAAATEVVSLTKDAGKTEACQRAAAETDAAGRGGDVLKQNRTTVRLSLSSLTSRKAGDAEQKDSADASAAAAAASAATASSGTVEQLQAGAAAATARSGARDVAAERQRMRSAAELLTGSATSTSPVVAATAVAKATTLDGAKVERFSSRLERVIPAPLPVQVDVHLRYAEATAQPLDASASPTAAASTAASGGIRVRSSAAGASWSGPADGTCVDQVPAAVDGADDSARGGALRSASGIQSGQDSWTEESVEEQVSVRGGVTSTSRTVMRSVTSTSSGSTAAHRLVGSAAVETPGELRLRALSPLPASAGAVAQMLTQVTSDYTASKVVKLLANGGNGHEASSVEAAGSLAAAAAAAAAAFPSPTSESRFRRRPQQADLLPDRRGDSAAAASSGLASAVPQSGTGSAEGAAAAVTAGGRDRVSMTSADADATDVSGKEGAGGSGTALLLAASSLATPVKKTISFGKTLVKGGSELSSSSDDDDRDSESSFDEGSYDGRKGEVSYVCKEDESLAEGVHAAVSRISSSKSPPKRSSSPAPADGGTAARADDESSGGRGSASAAAASSAVSAAAVTALAATSPAGTAGSAEDPACDVDVELQAACSIVQQHIESEGAVPASQVTSALSVIQQDWFKVGGGRAAVARDVEEYLSCFNDFSGELLSRVVNMTDANGNTVLHYAVSHCNFDVVRLIVDADVADVNKQNRAGYTPIMLAALADPTSEHDRTILRRLLSKGDVNLAASRAGQTALMLAVSHGRVDMVRLLLDAGADVNAQDEDGSTALMCATEHGHTDIVRLLLGRPECDASIKDNDGSTALSIALETAQKEIGLLLYAREHGGKAVALPQAIKKRVAKLPIPVVVATGTGRASAGAGSSVSTGGGKVLAKKSK